jgi:hypothetical protein
MAVDATPGTTHPTKNPAAGGRRAQKFVVTKSVGFLIKTRKRKMRGFTNDTRFRPVSL